MIKSNIQESFGITGKEAIKMGIIQTGTRLNMRTGNIVRDGWECIANGNNYATQFEAVATHFQLIQHEKSEFEKRWANADLHWFVHQTEGCNRHVLTERASGKILLDTLQRDKIIEFFDEHPALTREKKIIKASEH